SLEAQIANVADECAYTSHDLDDGLRSGMLLPEDLTDLALWTMLRESAGWTSGPLDELTRHRMIRAFIGLAVKDIAGASERRLADAGVQSQADIRRLSENVIRHSDAFAPPLEALRGRLFEKLYRHWRVMRMAVKAEKFLSELFAMYIANPDILPPAARKCDEEDIHRVACDYIAGMTDRFALEEYEKLTDPHTRP
ncbi:MAG: deoxyguanosinetriphosphate triphosphohydrolase, partial [Anaerolineales bacterium]